MRGLVGAVIEGRLSPPYSDGALLPPSPVFGEAVDPSQEDRLSREGNGEDKV